MKLIGPQNGIAALRAPVEEIGAELPPPFGAMNAKLIETFGFVSFPVFPHTAPNANLAPTIAVTYQQGHLSIGGEQVSFGGLQFTQEGVIITCRRTEHADAALDQLSEVLDSTFGSHYKETKRKRSYNSTLVVEFEGGFFEDIEPIARMERAITEVIKGNRHRPDAFHAKHLAFGQEPGLIPNVSIFEAIERADFMMERRVQHAFAENVFFSSAPISTPDHLTLLEKLEAIALGRD